MKTGRQYQRDKARAARKEARRMAQIESYEKPYNIVFGQDGTDEPQIFKTGDGPDFPVYKARQMVLALLTAEIKKLDEDQREVLTAVREQFRNASAGDLVFGYVKRWTNAKGAKRFIAIVPKGRDYRRAGELPKPKGPISGSTGALSGPLVIERKPWEIDRDRRRNSRRESPPRQPSEAERIADQMAKASRAAVEKES